MFKMFLETIFILTFINAFIEETRGLYINDRKEEILIQNRLGKNRSTLYYMDKFCFEPMTLDSRDAIRMSLWSTMYPPSTFTCTVRVKNRKYDTYGICLTFKFINMTSKSNASCLESRLDLFGGFAKRLSETGGICGTKAAKEQYSTSQTMLTMVYSTNKLPLHSQETFLAVLTPFHTGSCLEDEFKCSNGRCIKNNAVCDGYDNCGDDSDEKSCGHNKEKFSLSLAAIIGIAAGGAVIIVIGIIVMCCFWCCKYCSYERI